MRNERHVVIPILALLIGAACTETTQDGKPPVDLGIMGQMDGRGLVGDMSKIQPDMLSTAPGTLLFAKRFGGPGQDIEQSVATDRSDNIILSADIRSPIDFGGGVLANMDWDVAIAKFDSNGTHLWSKRFGGADWDFVGSTAVDQSNNVFISGSVESPVDFGTIVSRSRCACFFYY